MALVAFPPFTRVTGSSLELEESQAIAESGYNFIRGVTRFGGARWAGILQIAQEGYLRHPGEILKQRGYAIEAALRRMSDPVNSFEVPVHRPAATLSATATIGSVAGDTITVAGDASATAVPGALIRSDNRTWQVVEVRTALEWVLAPGTVMPLIARPVSGTSTVLGQIAADATPRFPHLPDWIGPWVINWVEVTQT